MSCKRKRVVGLILLANIPVASVVVFINRPSAIIYLSELFRITKPQVECFFQKKTIYLYNSGQTNYRWQNNFVI